MSVEPAESATSRASWQQASSRTVSPVLRRMSAEQLAALRQAFARVFSLLCEVFPLSLPLSPETPRWSKTTPQNDNVLKPSDFIF